MGIESHIQTPLAAAVRLIGSQSAFARLISRSQGFVHGLLRDGKDLPAEFVLLVEAATGVSKHDLRPDIYPRPAPATDAEVAQ